DDQQVDFKLIPDLLDIMRTGVEAAIIDGLPLIGIRRNRLRGAAASVKRAIDLTAAVILCIVLSPLLLAIAIVIRLSSKGPERFSGEVPRYLDRHQVRPGMTGWAQINDLRGDSSIAERTIYDIYYVENWTLALDLKILMLTIFRLLFQRHAY